MLARVSPFVEIIPATNFKFCVFQEKVKNLIARIIGVTHNKIEIGPIWLQSKDENRSVIISLGKYFSKFKAET